MFVYMMIAVSMYMYLSSEDDRKEPLGEKRKIIGAILWPIIIIAMLNELVKNSEK